MKSGEIVFRHPRYGDIDQFMRFINSLVSEKAHLGTQRKVTRKSEQAWVKQNLARIKKRDMVQLVVEQNDRIIGCADIVRGTFDATKHLGFLGIGLLPEARGKGIGMKLMRAVVEEAKRVMGIKILRVDAMATNPRALKLYKKFGCREICRIKKGFRHFNKFVDDVILIKQLR